ncbi:MAG: helix-turn-helix transcriptional regulator, partial [Deltaproteobacteria bacterium]|nr:helix-turn-helix transcriptional regulator [Deltaproteobacteria bacterium]
NLNLKGQRKVLTDTSKVKIELVKEFLEENYNEDISREDLAAEADMSPDHLGKMFKQYTRNDNVKVYHFDHLKMYHPDQVI